MAHTASRLMYGFHPEQWQEVSDTLGFDLPVKEDEESNRLKWGDCRRVEYDGMDEDFADLFEDVVNQHTSHHPSWNRDDYAVIEATDKVNGLYAKFKVYPFGVKRGCENAFRYDPPDALIRSNFNPDTTGTGSTGSC